MTFVCMWLTHLITYTSEDSGKLIGVTFDSSHTLGVKDLSTDLQQLERERFEVPRVALSGYKELLFIIPAGTNSITIFGEDRVDATCAYADDAESNASTPAFVALARHGQLVPLDTKSDPSPRAVTLNSQSHSAVARQMLWRQTISVPESLRVKLDGAENAQAVIKCTFPHSLAGSPTFSGRSLSIGVPNEHTGLVVIDMTAFDGISAIRFAGGSPVAAGNDRGRILDSTDRFVRVDWTDEALQEQRDVVLVLIGGLAAVAAAMAIEAIRPFVEGQVED